MAGPAGGEQTCREVLQAGDRDLFLASLFSPAPLRRAVTAIGAFAVDLSTIVERVREPMAGAIRLQWWRDALVADGPTGHPIADALADARCAHGLPAGVLAAMVDAQEAAVFRLEMASLTGLEDHLAASEGAVFALNARILGGQAGPEAAETAVRHAGLARGLARLPGDVARRPQAVSLLPGDLLSVHGLARGDIAAILASRGFLGDIASTARDHLAKARASLGDLPGPARAAFLPLAAVPFDLRRLDAGRPQTGTAPLARQLAIWRAARRGRL